jgi:hypothetical protein
MLDDLVVDTDVFVHASNPGVTYCTDARCLLTVLEGVSTVLRVDEGFDVDPARNRSLIGGQYLEHLHFGMLAFAFVSQLASTGRIIPVSRNVVPAVGKRINQIIRDKRDRTFLKVAINSDDRFFCSHDFNDFPHRKRVEIKTIFRVRIKTAGETLPFCSK